MHNSLFNNRIAGRRRGATMIVAIFFLAVMLAFVALVIDLGYLAKSRTELQRTADAAAMAACWEYAQELSIDKTHPMAAYEGYFAASTTAGENQICNEAPGIATSDVTWGRLDDFYDRHEVMDTSDSSTFNAVRVSVLRTEAMNGRIPVFFAKVFGVDGVRGTRSATAAIVRDVAGFRIPSKGTNLMILPITLDEKTWLAFDALGEGEGVDDYRWIPGDKPGEGRVIPGQDGFPEINLYPIGNDSPGNRGTVDIGSPSNSTKTIERQILYGITPEDMSYFENSELRFVDGELPLNGDTGISAGIKDELAAIIGERRCIPIFSQVQGPGNNAIYTIIYFRGFRIMDVKLTGKKTGKRLVIQKASIVCEGLIPGTPSENSVNVFSPVVLVR